MWANKVFQRAGEVSLIKPSSLGVCGETQKVCK